METGQGRQELGVQVRRGQEAEVPRVREKPTDALVGITEQEQIHRGGRIDEQDRSRLVTRCPHNLGTREVTVHR